MTLDRRLAKLEASLSPTEAVLAWLAEAHEFPTLPEYVASLLDAPKADWPLYRIGHQVEASTRAALKDRPKDVVWTSVRSRVADAFFRFELVLRINLAAEELVRFEGLRWALCRQWSRALSLEAELAELRHDPGTGRRREGRRRRGGDPYRSTLALSLLTLYTEEAARAKIAATKLAGRSVLFPGLVTEWDDLRGRLESLAEFADKLDCLRGREPVKVHVLRARASERVGARVSELFDSAQVETLERFGQSERAVRLVERRLRPPAGAAGEDRLNDPQAATR